jgi:hypothetical protein
MFSDPDTDLRHVKHLPAHHITGHRVATQRQSATPTREREMRAPWQDTISAERIGWRQRAANLDGDFAFAVDNQVCRRCRLGWVEQPHTLPQYQRCGLASAGLAALRAEYPGLAWHTLGGHFTDLRAFWAAVGAGAPAATSSVTSAYT